MAKPKLISISEKQIKLNALKVLRSSENTNKYDFEIKELEKDIDYFNYGIK